MPIRSSCLLNLNKQIPEFVEWKNQRTCGEHLDTNLTTVHDCWYSYRFWRKNISTVESITEFQLLLDIEFKHIIKDNIRYYRISVANTDEEFQELIRKMKINQLEIKIFI